MKTKWEWLGIRLRELGMTNTAFSKAIGWPVSRISEMINNTHVDGGKIRKFASNKLGIASKVLKVRFYDLWAYNEGFSKEIKFIDIPNYSPDTDESSCSSLFIQLIPNEQEEVLNIMRGMILRRKYEVPLEDKKGGGAKKLKAA